ncbi:MAG TPA: FAD-dependent oxidoreductase [Acetobacteraceae bacterium]|nr:FAD-dependent oxidoreductase [Acetobacteraceae bacterium]
MAGFAVPFLLVPPMTQAVVAYVRRTARESADRGSDKAGNMRIAVVGAGILGASAAYHLARAGAEVTIIDAAREGRATAAGAGIVCPWVGALDDPAFYALYERGARYYPGLLAALAECGAEDTGYARVGALFVSADEGELEAVERLARQRAAAAPEAGEVCRLSAREARTLFPPLHEGLKAVRVAGGARVDGRRMRAALLGAAARLGAVMREGEAALLAAEGRVSGVRLGGETLDTEAVVLAAGAWAPSLLAPLGKKLAIAPQRGQIAHLLLPGAESGAWPVILPAGSHYLLAFEGSRVVVGATREDAGFDYRVTARGVAEVLAEALRIAPGLANATLVETRIGFRPVGPGHVPMLGLVPDLAGLVIGNGLGAVGLTIGPYAGRLLAALALGKAPEMDLSPFAPAWGEAGLAGAYPVLR